MATDLDSKKAAPLETFVERELAETCRRIRRFDAGSSLLLLGGVVCFYAFAAALFDLATDGTGAGCPTAARSVHYLLFLPLPGSLLVQPLRRWFRRITPSYAARR